MGARRSILQPGVPGSQPPILGPDRCRWRQQPRQRHAGSVLPSIRAAAGAGNSPVLRDVYYLLMLLGSGAACFLLLWRNGFHVTSALFMATAWVLGGTMTQNINAIFGQTYATLPWLALAVDVLL